MAISIKSPEQIEKMRIAGRLASSVLEMIGEYVVVGVSTEKLDQICHDFIVNDLKSINIDITIIKDGFHGDTSKMFMVGKPSVKASRICKITQECLMLGIQQVKPGIH